MIMPSPLPDLIIEPAIRAALLEDLGHSGDISVALIPQDKHIKAHFVARAEGVIAGLACARLAMASLDQELRFTPHCEDGAQVRSQSLIATVEGPARAILTAERVALNFLGHLSGVASLTARYVTACQGTNARIAATRKTTPGLRALEKYAVQCGGAYSHRYGLHDCVLIKDNHIVALGGVKPALDAARKLAGPWRIIELEVDSLDQLDVALMTPPDIIMCDNFSIPDLTLAVKHLKASPAPRPLLEASGGVNLATVRAIAETGIDLISVGALTHSAPVLDIGLDAV